MRGPLLAGIDGAVVRRFGEEARERIVSLLPDEHADVLRRGRPDPLAAHDVDLLRLYCDLASRVYSLDPAAFRALGRDAVEHELAPFLRTVVLPGRLRDVLPRVVNILSRLADFGVWTLDQTLLDPVILRIDDFLPVTPLLRSFYEGVLERVVQLSVASEARATQLPAPTASPRFELEVTVG